jgi:ElaB/YqjD/DUF883 family membrane-anchored ribosome-binding protein
MPMTDAPGFETAVNSTEPATEPRDRATQAPTHDHHSAPPLVGLLNQVVQKAHDTIDRLADQALPAAQRLTDGVSLAEDTLNAKTTQLRITKQEWIEDVREAVRGNPLISVAAAAALGLVLVHLLRNHSQGAP